MLASLLAALLGAMTSAEAISVVLNSPSATSPKRYSEAKEIVLHDAEAGKPLQQFVAALSFVEGAKRDRYLEAARPKIAELAEKKDNSMAWYLLSTDRNDLNLLVKAANGGNVQALNAYGTTKLNQALADYAAGKTNGFERTVAICRKCFQRAVKARDPNGFINLGTCYMRGLGCDIDLVLAFECFLAAAELGHPEGMDSLSACYELGHGVERDAKRSLYWRMKAKATRGDAAAAEWLKEER